MTQLGLIISNVPSRQLGVADQQTRQQLDGQLVHVSAQVEEAMANAVTW
jgi:hypothetical protein